MFRPYRLGDLYLVLPYIRQAELDEAEALGEEPLTCLTAAIHQGETVTLELDGEVCGLAGVIRHEQFSTPWAVFTEKVEQCPVSFLKECRRWMDKYDEPMANVVDNRNIIAQKWIKWLGFSMSEPMPFGPHNQLFRTYWRGGVEWGGQ